MSAAKDHGSVYLRSVLMKFLDFSIEIRREARNCVKLKPMLVNSFRNGIMAIWRKNYSNSEI